MTKYLTLFLLTINLNLGFSQEDSTDVNSKEFHYGGRSGFYFTSYLPDFNYFTYFTFGFDIHEFSIGPSIGRPPRFYHPFFSVDYESGYKINGIDLTYRILPNGTGKIFDFYFQVDLFQKWGRANGDDIIHNWPNLYDQTKVDLTGKSVSTQMLFEFGFDVKFLKYIYIGPSVGIGGRMDFLNYDYGENSQFNYKENQFEGEMIFRANLGVRI